jgi:outer membrane lipoprotein SlyB
MEFVMFKVFLLVLVSIIASGCASTQPVVSQGASRTVSHAQVGTVLAVNAIRVEPKQDVQIAGTILGSLITGAVGSKVGKGKGAYVATALGGVIGAPIGKAVTNQVMSEQSYDVTVKGAFGIQNVTVPAADFGATAPVVGQQVLVVVGVGGARVYPHQ